MSEKEFGIFAMALKTYFPKDNLFPNKQSVDLWYGILNDIDYKTAELFLQKWVATNKWSPTIADIREGCADITQGEMQDWGKAWEQVEKAVRYYGMYREDEAYASMDAVSRAIQGRKDRRMSDLISRQAAIDALDALCDRECEYSKQ